MKASELAKLLLANPEFEVDTAFCEKDNSEYGMTVRVFKVNGIGDIGYSDKILRLGIEEV